MRQVFVAERYALVVVLILSFELHRLDLLLVKIATIAILRALLLNQFPLLVLPISSHLIDG